MTTFQASPVPSVRPRVPVAIVALCILEALLLGAFGAAAGMYGLLFGLVSDSCAGYHCDYAMITAGMAVTIIGCAVAAIGFDIVTIHRVRTRRSLPWLFPLIGFVVVVLFFWGGYTIVLLGAHLPLDGSNRPA